MRRRKKKVHRTEFRIRLRGPESEEDYSEESFPDVYGPHTRAILTRWQMQNPHEAFQLRKRPEDEEEAS